MLFALVLPLIFVSFGSVLRLSLFAWRRSRLREGGMLIVDREKRQLEVWSERILVLLKDEQRDGICWVCLEPGEWRNPTMPDWVWWLVVGCLVLTFPNFPVLRSVLT
jgi:hypothetical protein